MRDLGPDRPERKLLFLVDFEKTYQKYRIESCNLAPKFEFYIEFVWVDLYIGISKINPKVEAQPPTTRDAEGFGSRVHLK